MKHQCSLSKALPPADRIQPARQSRRRISPFPLDVEIRRRRLRGGGDGTCRRQTPFFAPMSPIACHINDNHGDPCQAHVLRDGRSIETRALSDGSPPSVPLLYCIHVGTPGCRPRLFYLTFLTPSPSIDDPTRISNRARACATETNIPSLADGSSLMESARHHHLDAESSRESRVCRRQKV